MSRSAVSDPPRGGFPTTRVSAIAGTRSSTREERQRSYDLLARAYWMPVCRYLTLRWGRPEEEARDLTQEFFAAAIEKGFFAPYDPSRARFRTFLRTCVDRFAMNRLAADGRLKRGGGASHVPIDGEQTPELERHAAVDPEEMFESDWVRSFFGLAVERLRQEYASGGRELHFRLFERYDLADAAEREGLTYAALALELGIKPTDVTNYLAHARRRFRALALELLRELTGSDEEFRQEARALLGASIP